MILAGIMVGRSLHPGDGGAGQELLLFQLLCSFLAPMVSRRLDPDRKQMNETPLITAVTSLSDAATVVMVGGLAIQTQQHLPGALALLGGAAAVSTITVHGHQAALQRLPKTFTEGEAWLCVAVAVSGALWLGTAPVAAAPATAAAAVTRLLQLDTLPVAIACATALFCCCAARPLQAAVQQWCGPAPRHCSPSSGTLLQGRGTAQPAADGSTPTAPAAPSENGCANGGGRAPMHLAHAARAHPSANGRRPAPPATLLLMVASYAAVMCTCAVHTVQYVVSAPHRVATVAAWAAAVAAAVPCMLLVARRGRVPHHILRKGFHILCLALFVPVLLVDPPLLSLALAVAFVALALAELLRTAAVPRLSAALTTAMARFTDSRDEGSFLVSHLSLLLGIAVPLWVSLAGSGGAADAVAPLTAWTGLITLGLADTVAATVGLLCGRVRVHRTSKKTAEGLLAATAATMAALGGAAAAQGGAHGMGWWLQVAWVSLLACMLEAVTLQLDNLVFAWLAFALLSLLR